MYILVTVISGIPTFIERFDDYDTARSRESEIRKEINLENDETGIFYQCGEGEPFDQIF